jgi:hypothetical protein
MNWGISPEAAATATNKILGYYPSIPASDPKQFAAGLVKLLTYYPAAVIAQAVDPAIGVPAEVSFLSLAEIKKHLDRWRDEYFASLDRSDRANRKTLAPPEPMDAETERRISRGFSALSAAIPRLQPGMPDPAHMKSAPDGYLASILVPEGHSRYASLVEQAKAEHRLYWRFDVSSEGEPGILVTHDMWDGRGNPDMGPAVR